MKKNYCSLTAYCRYIICMLLIFLWLATDSSAQVIKHFDFKDEQPFNTLTSVSQDSIGAIWLGSDSGIFGISVKKRPENFRNPFTYKACGPL